PWAKHPEGMVVLAAALGALSALGGLQMAFMFDTPTGPTIVCTAAGLFILSLVGAGLRSRG
ncbi:MAG: metal ABC transporter permease, partial [Planktomarina sp.]